jgi:hypothetical protein
MQSEARMFSDIQNRMAVYGLVVVVGAIGAISDAILNQWAKTGKLSWLLAAYASWLVVATLLGITLRWGYFSFGAAVVLFLLVNSVGALVLDHVLFSGRLSAWSWVGIGLALAAIVCIELGRPHNPPETDTGSTSKSVPKDPVSGSVP